jgi:hypothetical protein
MRVNLTYGLMRQGMETRTVPTAPFPDPTAADKAENLTGCKSLYRQLPVFGRLAYPERVEVTKHDMPGRKSPGCPVAIRSGRDDLGGEQTWRPEH